MITLQPAEIKRVTSKLWGALYRCAQSFGRCIILLFQYMWWKVKALKVRPSLRISSETFLLIHFLSFALLVPTRP